MEQMIDEDGNLWTVGPDGKPVFAGRAPQQQAGPQPFTVGTPRAPEPKAPYRFQSNDGSLVEIGPDGQPRVVFQDRPAPKAESNNGDLKQASRVANLRALQQNIQRVRELYQNNLKGGWPNAISGNVPSIIRPENEQFNSAGAGLSETGLAAFRVPGVGSQSDAELRAFVDANRPSASDGDLAIEEKLRNLETRLNATLQEMGIEPTAQQAAPNVLPSAKGVTATDPRAGISGATSVGGFRFDERLAGLPDAVAKMVGAGESSANIIRYMNEQYAGQGSVGPDMAAQIGYLTRAAKANPSAPVRSLMSGWDTLAMVPANQPQSAMGAIADTTGGNFAMHAANAATGGIPAMLAGEQGGAVMDATRQSRPGSSFAGELTGSIAAMYGINRAAGALGKIGRPLTRSGGVGGDALYGTVRGANENGLEGALMGGAAGAIGNKVGGALVSGTGAAVRGASSPAVRYLADRGVPMTAGQLLGNRGVFGKTMSALESIPLIGASLGARRAESFEALQREAMKDAGAGIGYTPQGTGFDAVERGLQAAGGAMDNSVRGVDVPMDPQAMAEMQAALAAGGQLPDDLAARFQKAIDTRVAPATTGGRLTGEGYQQAQRGLASYRAETPKPGFEADYRDALSQAGDALTGAIDRGAGPEVSQNLATAKTAYRDYKILQDAVTRGQNGANSGTPEVFTPAQLAAAVKASKYAKTGTKGPFRDLIRYGQDVLPSTLPNSGTADRAFVGMALPAALGGAAYGVGELTDPKIAAPLALLAALSSKSGAKLAQKAMTGRSPATRAAGVKILQQKRKAGLFGSALGSAVLTNSSQ